MEAIKERRRLLLIVLVVLVIVCLVGVLVYRILTETGDDVASYTPTPTLTPTEGPVVVITPEEETPTPTLVVIEEPTASPTTEPTAKPTNTPTPPATATPTPTTTTSEPGLFAPSIEDLLTNGDFEEGFDNQGVGLNWQSFKNDNVVVVFSSEAPGPLVKSGSSAQRISLAGATEGDRYGGIYQQLEVVPNQTYILDLHGQIRTGLADIDLSSYGYRMQYAIDYSGGDNWLNVPQEDWMELPWDEQLLQSPDVKFLDHTTEITPTSNQLTLFVRAWNKWPDPGLAEYTLDSLSLVGPAPGRVAEPGTGEALVDKGLPGTGVDDSAGLMGDGRFWGAVLILVLLAAGAIYRGRWGY
jgi:hypothetical protein